MNSDSLSSLLIINKFMKLISFLAWRLRDDDLKGLDLRHGYSKYARGCHVYVDICFADGVHGVRLSSGFVAKNSTLITVYRLAVRNLLLWLCKLRTEINLMIDKRIIPLLHLGCSVLALLRSASIQLQQRLNKSIQACAIAYLRYAGDLYWFSVSRMKSLAWVLLS